MLPFVVSRQVAQYFSTVGKARVLLMMALFYSGFPVRHNSVKVNQHGQYQDPETEAVKCNSAIIHFSCPLHTPVFSLPNVFHDKGL